MEVSVVVVKLVVQTVSCVPSDTEIPEESGVAIEYQIPQSSKRMDFILT
jgi:hypothetical protein